MARDTGMAGKVALLLWAQGDQGVPVLKTSVLHQCSTGDSLGTNTTPHPPGAAVPAGPPPSSPVPSPFQPRPSASLVSPRWMPCPCPAVPSPVVALAGWCPMSPAGAQTTQLLVEPPWTPAVLWDRVTLTCQGSRTASATTWYRDGQRWWQEASNHLIVTESGNYTCDRPGSGLSPAVRVLNGLLVLQVPARPWLEGDTVTLRCRGWRDESVTGVQFYHGDEEVRGTLSGTELSLSPLQLHHSGHYRCKGRGISGASRGWQESVPVTVTVHELFSVPVLEGPPEVTDGSTLILSCRSTPSLLRPRAPLLHLFYRDGQLVRGPQWSPLILVPTVGVSHSGNYSCQVRSERGTVQKSSARLGVTVRMPVANATITPGPLSHQVRTGDPVTLRCSVQVGSAPVTFTWLHNGQEVARGPSLELGFVTMGHSGTYQCVATNQLGQDGHRVFQALSPELALEVTPQGHWNTVATGVGGSLLFLVLLVGGVVGWRRWNHMAARNHQERAPSDSLTPPRDDPQATYMELKGPHRQPWEPSDIYDHLQQKL
ncbi:Fc receptor-like protein 4 isoform X2 [Prinia subflava]|uniref:Fc receptor-like protein 4 isoform X2 n=1 Tax=Prinia subflava TaxID=208062 RepID=UPI002FE35F42